MPVNLLNFAASGVSSLYGDYVGGTPEVPMSDPSYQKYYVRNAQFDALQPVMAFGRGPWEMGRDDLAAAVKHVALWHESMRPYIYDAALDGHETGYPYAMTPLPIAYPDDETTYGLANDTTRQYEWMLGESVLATPVFGADFETAQSRDVYLPAGKWIDIATGSVFQGPVTLDDYAMGYDRVPAFVGGKGVTVTGTADELRAQVYPIRTGSTYEFSDGDDTSHIRNDNTGWDPASLTVTDTSTRTAVDFDVDPVTGALSFPLTPGHDYRLTGGGTAEHSVPVDTTLPEPVTGLSHTEAGDLTTLRWDAAAGARGYVVSVSGHGACPTDDEVVSGATSGAVELTLGAPESVGGTYRVQAVNNIGAGPFSEGHTVVPPADDDPGPVVVTNEGEPPTCDPEHPAYEETGVWSPSAVSGFDESRTRFSREIGATATWRASLTPGAYDVAVWFPANSICSSDTTYTVRHAGGSDDIPVDQCATGGQWHSLGSHDFADGFAEVTLTVGGGTVRSDAVRFSPIG
nr:TIM-barrel domain-containing protein [Jiangella mangrovi]